MSMRFSIFTKGLALVLVLAVSMTFMQEAQAYHCDGEEQAYWYEMGVLGALGAISIGSCSPGSLVTIAGILVCGGSMTLYFLQAEKVKKAKWAWDQCKAEHEPN